MRAKSYWLQLLIEKKSAMEHKLKLPLEGPLVIVEKESHSLYYWQGETTTKYFC